MHNLISKQQFLIMVPHKTFINLQLTVIYYAKVSLISVKVLGLRNGSYADKLILH